jgi:hypothetical protein
MGFVHYNVGAIRLKCSAFFFIEPVLIVILLQIDPHLWIQYAQFQISNSNAKEARQAYLKALKFTDKADISERHYITEELERIIEVP